MYGVTVDRLTQIEAAAYLRCSPKTLRNQRQRGEGPRSYVLARRVFYDRADLDLFIAKAKAATLVGS